MIEIPMKSLDDDKNQLVLCYAGSAQDVGQAARIAMLALHWFAEIEIYQLRHSDLSIRKIQYSIRSRSVSSIHNNR